MLLRKWSAGTPRERTAAALILAAATVAAWVLRPHSDFGGGVIAGVRGGSRPQADGGGGRTLTKM